MRTLVLEETVDAWQFVVILVPVLLMLGPLLDRFGLDDEQLCIGDRATQEKIVSLVVKELEQWGVTTYSLNLNASARNSCHSSGRASSSIL